jgi:hypothetical protein
VGEGGRQRRAAPWSWWAAVWAQTGCLVDLAGWLRAASQLGSDAGVPDARDRKRGASSPMSLLGTRRACMGAPRGCPGAAAQVPIPLCSSPVTNNLLRYVVRVDTL